MINIWDYQDANRVRITDVDGQVFEGNVISVDDAEESSDLEKAEDNISIMTDDGRYIGIYQSEIAKIDVIVAKAV